MIFCQEFLEAPMKFDLHVCNNTDAFSMDLW
jgi:hypothetical protein